MWKPLTAVFFGAGLASAAVEELTIQNAGFETPAIGADSFQTTNSNPIPATGWSIYGEGGGSRHFGVLNPTDSHSFPEGAPAGNNVGVIFLNSGTAEAGLQQTLEATLAANTTYTLHVDVGNIAPDPDPEFPWNFSGFPGYRIELVAGGAVIASETNVVSPGEGEFESTSISVTTDDAPENLGEALTIRLINLNAPGIEVNWDNVRLTAETIVTGEPEALGVSIDGSDLVMEWQAGAGASVVVEQSNDLNGWNTLSTGTASGSIETARTALGTDPVFLRVRID